MFDVTYGDKKGKWDDKNVNKKEVLDSKTDNCNKIAKCEKKKGGFEATY